MEACILFNKEIIMSWAYYPKNGDLMILHALYVIQDTVSGKCVLNQAEQGAHTSISCKTLKIHKASLGAE